MKDIKPEGTFTVGKPKVIHEFDLTVKEKDRLKNDTAAHVQKLQAKNDAKYHDGFESSIMMSKEDTISKNEILRRIKWQKTKKN